MSIRLLHILTPILLLLGCKVSNNTSKTLSSEQDRTVYYPSIISTEQFSENSISFTKDESTLFLSRTTGWEYQSGHLSLKKNGNYTALKPIDALDTIYNGAINPSGNKIVFCRKNNGKEETLMLLKEADKWSKAINLSETSGIYGGYFYWWHDTELYFYVPEGNGNIVRGKLQGNQLQITDRLKALNTEAGTEFSPFVDREKQFLIFTRYLESNVDEQGFFISFNTNTATAPKWSEPQKIQSLPYGWNPYIIEQEQLFLYSDGEDIIAVPMKKLKVEIDALRKVAVGKN